mmetsp:Transcript_72418/g.189800  ORF Transcript_72418/g.189800 Transcript_72418/m.189800 type:complete len:252 (+) Transcript_72418:1378-2133(+)
MLPGARRNDEVAGLHPRARLAGADRAHPETGVWRPAVQRQALPLQGVLFQLVEHRGLALDRARLRYRLVLLHYLDDHHEPLRGRHGAAQRAAPRQSRRRGVPQAVERRDRLGGLRLPTAGVSLARPVLVHLDHHAALHEGLPGPIEARHDADHADQRLRRRPPLHDRPVRDVRQLCAGRTPPVRRGGGGLDAVRQVGERLLEANARQLGLQRDVRGGADKRHGLVLAVPPVRLLRPHELACRHRHRSLHKH